MQLLNASGYYYFDELNSFNSLEILLIFVTHEWSLGWSEKGYNQWILTEGILKVGF